MKTHLKTNHENLAVAYLTPAKINVSLAGCDNDKLIQQDINLFSSSERIPQSWQNIFFEHFLTGVRSNSAANLVIILSTDLTLFSRHTMPASLTKKEVCELLVLQQNQRMESSNIRTYYDHIKLASGKTNQNFVLFEARYEPLFSVINMFEHYGYKVVAMIPEQAVVINQVVMNKPISESHYGIAFLIRQQGYVVEVLDGEVARLVEVSATGESMESIVEELGAKIVEINCATIIMASPGLVSLEKAIASQGVKVANFSESGYAQNIPVYTINWMRKQYDLYQSVTLA